MMGNIKIKEYKDCYASKLADMWNKSGDNWGGYDTLKTELDVINDVKNSGDLNVYLALDEEEVVGYCSFSEYKQDDGASYIPLLNVRPDYHGRKVGKKLVLTAVERAINSEWPRLDLYTWPGNTKAVPLYKKCGFFWEKRDDSTHLMNFIPSVLKTEAVSDFFEIIDWYKDSKRIIEVKNDGRKENGFDLFEYYWEKDNISLRMEYERKGRGLRLIETDDYLIKATIKKQELVFGMEYKIFYDVVNKSGKDLNISIKGFDDKNIKFNYSYSNNIKNDATIEGSFYVDEIKEEQSIWRTHPCVSSEILINGKKAVFKVGIEPKFPVKAKMIVPNKPNYIGEKSVCYIDLENSFDKKIKVKFNLPESKIVDFVNKEFEIEIEAEEKTSISVPYIMNKYGFYSESVEFRISIEDKEIVYKKKLTSPFKSYQGKFYGESDDEWMLFNGKYTVKLMKFDNDVAISNYNQNESVTFILPPKLGLPYSLEFSKIKPEKVDFYVEEDASMMKATYKSRDFKDIQVVSIVKLYTNGLLENYYEVYNLGENEINQNMMLSHSVYLNFEDSYLPYDGKLVRIDGTDGANISYFDNNKLNENWIFSHGNKVSRGICWSNESKVNFNDWYMSLDSNLGKIKEKSYIKTEPLYILWGAFDDYKDFRAFAMKNNELDDLTIVDTIDYEINEGNPFIKEDYKVKIKNYKKATLEGSIKVKSNNKGFDDIIKEVNDQNHNSDIEIPIYSKSKSNIDMLEIEADLKDKLFKKDSVVFKVSNKDIKTEIINEHNMDVFLVDNGLIQIKAAPDFSDTLFSIKYNNHEWLDSSFPTPRPKAWWSPWCGGLGCRPSRFSDISAQEEKKKCEFVEMKDNLGNNWKGIKLSLLIEKNEKYKGIQINSYFLLLPGTQVLHSTTELIQNSGRYFNDEKFDRGIFIKADDVLIESNFIVENENGDRITYKCGNVESDIHSYSPMMYEGKHREEKLIIFNTGENGMAGYTSNKISFNIDTRNVSLANNTKSFITSDFLIFNEDYLDGSLLENLKNINFK